MKRRASREMNVFGLSFMDVLANAVGGLAFLLILAVMMVGAVAFLPPQITTEQLPPAYDGHTYEVWLAAREGLGKFEWTFGEGTYPPGLKLDPKSGRMAGEIELPADVGDSATYEFEVLCTVRSDQQATTSEVDRRRLAITVLREAPATVLPLQIVTEKLPDAYGGQPYPLTLAAEGGQPPFVWRADGELPEGLALDSNGRFNGSPRRTGIFRLSATTTDAGGQKVAKSFTLTVSEKHPPPVPPPPLSIVTKELPAAVARRRYALYLAAEGGTPPYRWSIIEGRPAWLNAQAALLSGTPSTDNIGKFELRLKVTDSKGASVESDSPIVLTVLRPEGPLYRPLALRTKKLAEAQVGHEYHVPLSAEGGTPPYRWSLTPALPELGIQFSSEDGVLSGTPEQIGSADFQVAVRDSGEESAQTELTLRVRPAEQVVKILTSLANDGRVGDDYDVALSATGGHPPYVWKMVDGGSLPPGLRFDGASGRIAGKPSEAGTWKASFSVRDAEGRAADEALPLELTVLTSQGFTKLVVLTHELPTLLKGETTNIALASEGGRPPYRWEISGQPPPGLDTNGPFLIGQPQHSGDFPTSFQVKDSSGQSVDAELPISVRSMLPAWLVYLVAALLAVALLAVVVLFRGYRSRRPQPLRINTQALPNARASCDYHVQLSCVGGVPPYVWSINEGDLPLGMELTEEGQLMGCPLEGIAVDQTQDFPFSVIVRDAAGTTAIERL